MRTTGERHRGTRTRRAWALRGLVTWGAGLLLVAVGPVAPAFADPCPLIDPLCVTETVEDTVDQTVDTVKDHANTTVEKVRTTVKDLTDSGTDDPGGDGGGNGGGKGHGSTPNDPGLGSRRTSRSGATTTAGSSLVVPTTVSDTTPMEQLEDEAANVRSQDLPEALREAMIGLALPLLLVLGIVVGFTVIQNSLDRRDPKLALAPLAVDVLRFE